MKKSVIVVAAVLGMGLGTAFAEDGAILYKKCVACHGMQGEKPALSKSRVIREMGKEEFVNALKGYREGTYGGAQKGVMKGQVASLSDAQIDAIADYLIK